MKYVTFRSGTSFVASEQVISSDYFILILKNTEIQSSGTSYLVSDIFWVFFHGVKCSSFSHISSHLWNSLLFLHVAEGPLCWFDRKELKLQLSSLDCGVISYWTHMCGIRAAFTTTLPMFDPSHIWMARDSLFCWNGWQPFHLGCFRIRKPAHLNHVIIPSPCPTRCCWRKGKNGTCDHQRKTGFRWSLFLSAGSSLGSYSPSIISTTTPQETINKALIWRP